MRLGDLFDLALLERMLGEGYVRRQVHPDAPLAILNYTERAAYDRAWNDVTRQCRGLIYNRIDHVVVARPFPKFFNHGEPDAPELAPGAWCRVTEKMDGSLGILYPTRDGHAVATRGSFVSEQALHATQVLHSRYAGWTPSPGMTYLFEVVFPGNRVVCDYGDTDDLFLLAIIDIESGWDAYESDGDPTGWPGPRVAGHPYRTLAEALAADARPGAEGLVVEVITGGASVRVKVKQDDYVALHRILTGTNARHVYEVAAVRSCHESVVRSCASGGDEAKHWASYVGLDPARVDEILALGEGWLDAAGIPDEFYEWVRRVIDEAEEKANDMILRSIAVAREAARIGDRADRFAYIRARVPQTEKETMRLASGPPAYDSAMADLDRLRMRAWRLACPPPTAPFQRAEAVA